MSIVEFRQQPEVPLKQLDYLLQGFRHARGTVSLKNVRLTPDLRQRAPDQSPPILFFCPSWLGDLVVEKKKKNPRGRKVVRQDFSNKRVPIYLDGLSPLLPPGESFANVDNIEFIIDGRGLLFRAGEKTSITTWGRPSLPPLPGCSCPICRPYLHVQADALGESELQAARLLRQAEFALRGAPDSSQERIDFRPPLQGTYTLPTLRVDGEAIARSLDRFRQSLNQAVEPLSTALSRELNS